MVRELIAQYREAVEADWSQMRLAIGRLQKLLPEGARPEQRARLDLDAVSTQYHDRLLRRLEALGIRVAPIPDIPL